MFRNLTDTPHARRSPFLAAMLGATTVFLLLVPTSAQAVEQDSPKTGTSQSSELTADQIAAVTDQQIMAANSGTAKFTSADLVEKVRKQIQIDYEVREKKREAEAAAKAKAEEEARKAAEEAARVEAEKKAAAEKAAAEKAAADAASADRLNAQSTNVSSPLYTGGGSKDEWLKAAGIAESDWAYVDYIVSKESSWNPNAINSSSGASGLVQALPCGKVPGSCFNPVDNLKWANGYAKDRYGSWKGAYDFWVSNHWW